MIRPSTRSERIAACVILLGALIYLIPFVARGWIPHDEGMIGQSAERVLLGEIPHVDYEEPYTGGLSWAYAAVFKLTGINLVGIRWLLFAGASLAQLLVYVILRRYLAPVGAAVAACVALAWSFPNFFAGLPSWWVLICALSALWALIRYVETARLRYVAVAGLAAGVSVIVKQTGVYLVPPLLMAVWLSPQRAGESDDSVRDGDRLLRIAFGLCALTGAALLLRTRLRAEEIVYLLVPVAASSLAFGLANLGGLPGSKASRPVALLIAGGSAVLPLVLFLIPYAADGHLEEFISGAFILPQKRLTFATLSFPPAPLILCGVLMAFGMLMVPRLWTPAQNRVFDICRWIAALLLVTLSLRMMVVYQVVWQSARAMAALLPPAVLWLIVTGAAGREPERIILFAASSMLAWASLVQFPYGAPVYFCYVAPLAVICGVAVASADLPMPVRNPRPWLALVLAFAMVGMHPGYLDSLGLSHRPETMDVPLGLERASLRVTEADAHLYRRATYLVNRHIRDGALVAGPDCPELYFLTAQLSRTGTLFDFFAPSEDGSDVGSDDSRWLAASVVVINHQPGFTPRLRPDLISKLRQDLPEGEIVGRFEVRWR